MKREYKILLEVYYWQDKLKMPRFLVGIDNKSKYVAYIRHDCQENMDILYLNLKYMQQETELDNIATIFHEFGHMKDTIYRYRGGKKAQIDRERVAEIFALKQLKRHFPKLYKRHIEGWKQSMKKKHWQKAFPVHYKAFSQIKEYKEA
jgi:hypothetical protein